MKPKVVSSVFCFLLVGLIAWGQVGNGTVTGTITDQAGAVVAAAKVEAKNAETGVVYPAASTATGNYTIADLPAGSYALTVTMMGFKTFLHSNLTVQAAGTVREDVRLEAGTNTELVTVRAETSLLKTESGELAYNVTVGDMDQLPLLGIGTVNAGPAGYRNPYNTLLTLPGVSNYQTDSPFQVNGLGNAFSTTETMRVEGQDATVRLFGAYDYTEIGQPGADSVQEIAYQVSNYAPEFGQAGSAVINLTMKGGTNRFHGSGYEYLVNEDLNAGDPFSISGGPGSLSGGDGGKFRPRNRRNDFGGTLGGPVYIPKIYDGHNKTFFFWSYEEYLETTQLSFTDTVPYSAYTQGNFSGISPVGTCSLCALAGLTGSATQPLGNGYKDPLGSVQYANEIYDPLTRGTAANGLGYAYPFPANSIPPTRFDRVSVIFQDEFPAPSTPSLISGNYDGQIPSHRYSAIPSIKIDHNVSAKDKLSFYYSENNTQSQVSAQGFADGLPLSIGQYVGTFIPTWIYRLNYDRTLSPTLLLHMGIGYQRTKYDDPAPVLNYNAEQTIGIAGFLANRNIPVLNGVTDGQFGGMQNVGPPSQTTKWEGKVTSVTGLTWVKGRHTFKFGGEAYFTGDIAEPYPVVTFTAGQNATSEPFTPAVSYLPYSTGFNYASFLLGDYNTIAQSAPGETHTGYQTWDWYAQDSWKIARKLTIDYGLRYDLNTVEKETYNRWAQFGENVINLNAGGHPGGTVYGGYPGFQYQPAYPWAFGPRIGVAYQLDPKTVLRAGWGLAYQFVGAAAGSTVSVSGLNQPAGINSFVDIETPGAVPQPVWPVLPSSPYCGIGCVNPASIYPNYGTTAGAPTMPDRNQNRPPRIDQYSFGIQREFTRNFILEAAYVGNHAVWLPGPLGFLNQISAQDYAMYGLFPLPGTGPCPSNPLTVCPSSTYNNNADRALLSQPVSSVAVMQHEAAAGLPNSGYLLPYYSASPSTLLSTAIKAYPQFPNLGPSGSPTGDSLYNSLQAKATKRFSHNLQAGGSFTWAKSFTRAARQSDFFNPNNSVWDLQNIPFRTLNFNLIYTVPKAGFFNKWENLVTEGWQVGFFGNYQTGQLLTPPGNPTAEQVNGEEFYTGQPFYMHGVNINNHSTFNPYFTQVLNPGAWAQCPINAACPATGTLYPGFRGPRMPIENANIGRNFRIKERMNLQIRGEFVNVFNRTIMANPGTSFNPQSPIIYGGLVNGVKVLTAGYGVIDAYAAPNTALSQPPNNQVFAPRTGTVIARFSF